MMCLSCRQPIQDNLTECPFCHAHYNAEKLRFIKYIGDENSLVGYQKSYKLVLLKNIFELLRLGQQLSVDSIMYTIKEFYLTRVHKGFPADYEVDDRIKNISEKTSIYDIWAVFKANPYNVINNQGFLFLEKNTRGELIFVLPEDITSMLTEVECNNLITLIEKKLALYYSKLDGITTDGAVTESTSQTQADIICAQPQQPDQRNENLIPIVHTRLSRRAKGCLLRSGYVYIQDILNLTEGDLYQIRNMGYKSVEEIKNLISDYHSGVNVLCDDAPDDPACKLDETDVECLLQDTSLSVRAKNVLIRAGYNKVGDILEVTEEELASYRNLGRLTIQEILEFVKNIRIANGFDDDQEDGEYSIFLQPIKSTSLSNRAKNSLLESGYQVVGDILELTEPELWSLPRIGGNTVEEILLYSVTLKQKLADEATEDSEQNYESIKYPYISISAECEQVPVPVLAYFGMQHSLIRKLQGQGINKLGQLKSMDYLQIQTAMSSEWNKLLHFTLGEFSKGAIHAVKIFLDNISAEEDLSFIVERSRGATLQELGNKYGATREGIRQKIEKPLKFIKPMAVCLVKALMKEMQVKFLTLQDVYDVYDNDDYDAIISYALRESEDIETIEALDLFFIKGEVSYNNFLQNAIQEYVGEGINWHRNINQLIEILQEKNLSFVEIDDAWRYMLSMGYKVYGEYVAPRAVSYGTLLAIIIEEEFSDGIAFSDVAAVDRLRRRAFERFGNLNLPEEDKALIARVADLLVICDRGKWIAPNRVDIEISTLETIKEYIDQSPNNIIYYQALFNQFEGLLTMTSSISNYHYLHGILRYYYGTEYTFGRDSLQKEAGNISGSLAKRIYDYIVEKGQAVSRKELKEHLKITSDVMIFNTINSNKDIFQWEFNYYNCLGNIKITPSEEDLLHEIIAELFAKNLNYCSAKMVYEYCDQLMPEMIERNIIKNPTNLFYIVATLMGDKYKCRCPHILPLDSRVSATEDIARMFINNAEVLKWDEFSAFIDRLGWGQSTANIIFTSIVNADYYRISRREYLRKDKLILKESQICSIKEVLDSHLDGKPFIGSWEINYHLLPDIGHEWTPHLLDTVVTWFVDEYRMILPYYGARKTERGLIVASYSELKTYDGVVESVIRAHGRHRLTENELYTLLVLVGVIKGVLPNELRESKLFTYNDGIYTLKESV